jgi:hypothetical protein
MVLVLAITVLCTTHALSDWPPDIAAVSVVANYQEYSGPCPAKLVFTATVNVTKVPMSFNFQWERSDGVKSKMKIMHVPSGHTGVVTIVEEWQLGTKGKHVSIYEKLHVKSGNLVVTSAPAVVVVNCR